MLVTFEVTHKDMSLLKELALLNIFDMLVTFEVSHEDKSPLNELAWKNMYCTLFEKKQNNMTAWLEIIDSFSNVASPKIIPNSYITTQQTRFNSSHTKNILQTYSSFHVNLPTCQ